MANRRRRSDEEIDLEEATRIVKRRGIDWFDAETTRLLEALVDAYRADLRRLKDKSLAAEQVVKRIEPSYLEILERYEGARQTLDEAHANFERLKDLLQQEANELREDRALAREAVERRIGKRLALPRAQRGGEVILVPKEQPQYRPPRQGRGRWRLILALVLLVVGSVFAYVSIEYPDKAPWMRQSEAATAEWPGPIQTFKKALDQACNGAGPSFACDAKTRKTLLVLALMETGGGTNADRDKAKSAGAADPRQGALGITASAAQTAATALQITGYNPYDLNQHVQVGVYTLNQIVGSLQSDQANTPARYAQPIASGETPGKDWCKADADKSKQHGPPALYFDIARSWHNGNDGTNQCPYWLTIVALSMGSTADGPNMKDPAVATIMHSKVVTDLLKNATAK